MTPLIHVTGDPVVHWAQLIGTSESDWTRPATSVLATADYFRFFAQHWGAQLIKEILVRVEKEVRKPSGTQEPAFELSGIKIDPDAYRNGDLASVVRDFALWREDDARVWRMQRFVVRHAASSPPGDMLGTTPRRPACLVIDDMGMGFRTHKDWWPKCLSLLESELHPEQIILKMAAPIDLEQAGGTAPKNRLWSRLSQDPFVDQLTVYCKVDSLRQQDFSPIGGALSWERTGQDVVKSIRASGLSRARRVVVSLGLSGAILYERSDKSSESGRALLIFDPLHQEGDWERQFQGTPLGVGRYIVASIAASTALSGWSDESQWINRIETGLAAARKVLETGFGTSRVARMDFVQTHPVKLIAGTERASPGEFRSAPIEMGDRWTLLKPSIEAARSLALTGNIDTTIDGSGAGSLPPYPLERMGNWMSVNRTEIESMRSLRYIIREYLASTTHSLPYQPLNLAVFGPPGSGKSFIVKEMINYMEEERVHSARGLKVVPFNLSQMKTGNDLVAAFHEIRDWVVNDYVPVVFWDEFDSSPHAGPLGWLSSFLVPMQDGKFSDGRVEHPIGRSIFIFAGGVFKSMGEFEREVELMEMKSQDIRSTKSPDFLSRLRGYIDIIGPDEHPTDDGPEHFLRRAVLLRGLFKSHADGLFDSRDRLRIEPSVLDVFLLTAKYKHGARSMEAIIRMSVLSGKHSFQRSSLPAGHQLAPHVDEVNFLRFVDKGQGT